MLENGTCRLDAVIVVLVDDDSHFARQPAGQLLQNCKGGIFSNAIWHCRKPWWWLQHRLLFLAALI